MRILFVSSEDYLSEKVGGAEWSTHFLCLELQRRSIEVAVLARRKRGHTNKWVGTLPGFTARFEVEHEMGYPIFRAWNPEVGIKTVVEGFSPSIIIAIAGFAFELAERLEHMAIPVILYLRDTKHWLNLWSERFLYLANSRFIAEYHETHYGIKAPVIQPLVPLEHYSAPCSRNRVVMINPKPEKGVETVFELARLSPDIEFEIVECWPLRIVERLRLKLRAKKFKNIIWRSPIVDMKCVYRTAKIVLVPSLWPEGWCRVVTEAHCNGIPIIASNLGGLPESVGNGGLLVDPDASLSAWKEALCNLWNNQDIYNSYSRAALEYSKRSEINVEKLTSRFIKIMSEMINK